MAPAFQTVEYRDTRASVGMTRASAKAHLTDLLSLDRSADAMLFWSRSALTIGDLHECSEWAARAVLEGLRGAA